MCYLKNRINNMATTASTTFARAATYFKTSMALGALSAFTNHASEYMISRDEATGKMPPFRPIFCLGYMVHEALMVPFTPVLAAVVAPIAAYEAGRRPEPPPSKVA